MEPIVIICDGFPFFVGLVDWEAREVYIKIDFVHDVGSICKSGSKKFVEFTITLSKKYFVRVDWERKVVEVAESTS